jgi:ComEC/Rec2-related protein
MIKYPLVPMGILMGAGIWLGDCLETPPGLVLAAAGLLAAAALLHRHHRKLWLMALVILTGWANLACRTAALNPHDLRRIVGAAEEEVVIQGSLEDFPTVNHFEKEETTNFYSVVTLKVRHIRCGRRAWQPADGWVMTSTRGILPEDFWGGRLAEVAGVIAPPKTAALPGAFDYREHLRHKLVYYQLRVLSPEDWHPLEPAASRPPLSDRFIAWAQQALAKGLPAEDEELHLLWAMLLGWKPGLTNEISAPFMQTGTLHVFAISGLHIAMMAGVLLAVLRMLSVPRDFCGLVAIPMIWFYTGATGWQASAIRSAIMASVIILGWAMRRPSNLLNSLFAAAIIIFLWEPQQLFQASFQLSFFVVLSIALLIPILEAKVFPWMHPDPLVPHDYLPVWKRAWYFCARYPAGCLCVSASAWLGSLPLIAVFFNMITPVSLLANLLIVPLSGLCLTCGMASLLTGWLPVVPELFNHSNWFFMRCMVVLSDGFAAIPGAYFYVATPGSKFIVIYYALLIAATFVPKKIPAVRGWGFAALGVFTLGWLLWPSAPPQLSILPVDDGIAILSHGPGRKDNLLVDTGRAIPAQRTLVPFLRASGAGHLSGLVLSHGDVRQMDGAETIRTNCRVARVLASPLRFRSPGYRDLQQRYEKIPHLWQTITPGDTVSPWTVLYPAPGTPASQADDGALVLRGDLAGVRVLLLSHLGRGGQNLLMQQVNLSELRADIVVAGLPAEREPLAGPLLHAIRPKLVIITDARFPAELRASRALEQRLFHERATTLYTRKCGWIQLNCARGNWTATAADGTVLKSQSLPYLRDPTYLPPDEER